MIMRMKFVRAALVTAIFCAHSFFAVAEGAPISIQASGADVRSVLLTAARSGGYNLVIDDAVQGTVSLHMNAVEPLDLLHAVARIKHLFIEERSGTYYIAPSGGEGAFRSLHRFPVQYGDPQELAATINLTLGFAGNSVLASNNNSSAKNKKESLREILSGAVPEEGASQILFHGTEAEARRVAELLRALDLPRRQLSLEARVVAIEKEAAKKLGVEWEWSPIPQYPKHDSGYEARYHTAVDAEGKIYSVREDVPTTVVERSYRGGASMPGILQFGHGPEGHPLEWYYAARLQALVTDGKAQILAKPNITTLHGKEAVIRIGGSVPVPKVTMSENVTTTSIDYHEAGIILRYTPRVHADGSITAEVHTEVSSPLYVEDMKAYRFQTRSADTTVRLKDGETMVIGGLIGSEESRGLSKIPFLGDLPILGAFFRSVRSSKSESEIMIFLTARLLDEKSS